MLILPDIDVQTWWTSLALPPADVIDLYRAHATCEQFHSEIKSAIGLERFPSGRFDTNAAIPKLAALTYNTLRIIGQCALGGGVKLQRHEVSRLRAKTVMKRFITMASHVTAHARQCFLRLGQSNIWRETFLRVSIPRLHSR